MSRRLAAGMRAAPLSIQPGQRVAIMAPTRVEWVVCDLAIALCGAISVPIYPSVGEEEVRHIVADSRCAAAYVAGSRAAGTLLAAGMERAHLIVIDSANDHAAGGPTFDSLRKLGEGLLDGKGGAAEALDRITQEHRPDDDLTWVYTSGTTGEPRGVILSHANAVHVAWAISRVFTVGAGDEQLMVLPLAHIFARHMQWAAIATGAVTSFSKPDLSEMENDMVEVAPTFVGAVPRMFEKIHGLIHAEFESGGALTREAVAWALGIGRQASALRQRGRAIPAGLAVKLAIADRMVFARIRSRFGGRLRFLISGGAPLSRSIAEFFHAAGVLILEGYGLTETSGAIAVNRPDRYRFGSVGPAIPGAEIRIADDGEILVRAASVMKGYNAGPRPSDPESDLDGSAGPRGARDDASLDADGWLHTGDRGTLEGGFLTITGRTRDLIVLSTGKNVAPRRIEGRLRTREGIAEVVVIGDRHPFLVALVAIDGDAMRQVSDDEGLGCHTYAELARHPRIRQIVQDHIDDINSGLSRYESIRRFAIPREPFTVAAGEMTPSFKVKRDVVARRHATVIEGLYGEDG